VRWLIRSSCGRFWARLTTSASRRSGNCLSSLPS